MGPAVVLARLRAVASELEELQELPSLEVARRQLVKSLFFPINQDLHAPISLCMPQQHAWQWSAKRQHCRGHRSTDHSATLQCSVHWMAPLCQGCPTLERLPPRQGKWLPPPSGRAGGRKAVCRAKMSAGRQV